MHELSVTAGILELALNEARARHITKIKQINIAIGDLSGIDSKCVDYYFNLLSRDTPAQESSITFKPLKSKFQCNDCGGIYERSNFSFLCPNCKGTGVIVESRTSVYIESMVV